MLRAQLRNSTVAQGACQCHLSWGSLWFTSRSAIWHSPYIHHGTKALGSTYYRTFTPHSCHTPAVSSSLKARLTELDELVADPKLYDDSRRAGKIVKERAQVEAKLETVVRLGAELQTWREMHGTRADPIELPYSIMLSYEWRSILTVLVLRRGFCQASEGCVCKGACWVQRGAAVVV